jgi:hypothetical protein
MVKPLEIHCGVPHYLLSGTWEGDRPPRKGKRKIGLQQLDLDAGGLNKQPGLGSGIRVNVGITKLLSPVTFLRIDDDQN